MQQYEIYRQDVQERQTCDLPHAAMSECQYVASSCAPQDPPHVTGPHPSEAPDSGVQPRRSRSTADMDAASVCPKTLKAYLPLVHQIVGQMGRKLPPNVLRDDLLSAGIFGLLDSLRRNGGDDGDSFEGYARMRIRGAVVDELRAQDWLSRRRRRALMSATQEEADAKVRMFVSLQDLTASDESDHLVIDEDDASVKLEAHDDYKRLVRAVAQLPERERHIIDSHYFEGVKLKDIGTELGVSEPRISQLHSRALGRLRLLIQRAA